MDIDTLAITEIVEKRQALMFPASHLLLKKSMTAISFHSPINRF